MPSNRPSVRWSLLVRNAGLPLAVAVLSIVVANGCTPSGTRGCGTNCDQSADASSAVDAAPDAALADASAADTSVAAPSVAEVSPLKKDWVLISPGDSDEQLFTVRNTGGGVLHVTAVTLRQPDKDAGAATGSFARTMTDTCTGKALGAGETCTFGVQVLGAMTDGPRDGMGIALPSNGSMDVATDAASGASTIVVPLSFVAT